MLRIVMQQELKWTLLMSLPGLKMLGSARL